MLTAEPDAPLLGLPGAGFIEAAPFFSRGSTMALQHPPEPLPAASAADMRLDVLIHETRLLRAEVIGLRGDLARRAEPELAEDGAVQLREPARAENGAGRRSRR